MGLTASVNRLQRRMGKIGRTKVTRTARSSGLGKSIKGLGSAHLAYNPDAFAANTSGIEQFPNSITSQPPKGTALYAFPQSPKFGNPNA